MKPSIRMHDLVRCNSLRALVVLSIVFLHLSCLPAHAADEGIEGLAEPISDVTLSFPVPGVLSKVTVKEGDPVLAGAVLAELNDETERLEVERRRLVVDASQKEYERTKQVFEKGRSISREELEQKEAAYKVAEVEQKLAEAELRRRQLTAPGAGVIVNLFNHEPGEAIAAGAAMARVVDVRECRFTCHVKGDANHGLAPGRVVVMTFAIGGVEKTVEGKVEFVSPVADAASGLQTVRARFVNKDLAIRPGLPGWLHLKRE